MKVMTKDEIDVLLKTDLSKPLKDEEKLLRGEKNSIKELEEDVFETI